ncbi:hypothetical protein B0A55_03236 [Friedmanniomyces simplex]|uniref:DUF7730 domain-containing protein n=1 Tax=Friedmanniomyces simplex TaxID=329884 RepID=A0A4U0XM67_9PEZI|nr:hypothetical protein B0A55_03236 [Friedmanniomyces simplex]
MARSGARKSKRKARPVEAIQYPIIDKIIDNTHFPFDKLPPALRNAVYLEYFVREEPIELTLRRRIMVWTHEPATMRIIRTPGPTHLNSGVSGTPKLGGEKAINLLGRQGASIPRANKMLSGEVLPILYGANTFSFSSLPSMAYFGQLIGPNATHLRRIKASFSNAPHLHAGLRHVAGKDHLEKMELPMHFREGSNTPFGVFECMGKAVVTFVSLGKTEQERRQRLESIRFCPALRYGSTADHRLRDYEGRPIASMQTAMELIKRHFRKTLVDKGTKAGGAVKVNVAPTKTITKVPSNAGHRHTKHTFPFEELPPELRNNIYRLVLVTAEGPIEVTGHINLEKRDIKRQPCSCRKTKPSKCLRCKELQETETYKLRVKTLAIQSNMVRRKPLVKNAYGGAIVSINRQVHQEAAAILYAENSFVFGSHGAFQRFCAKIGSKVALLRDIEIKNLHPPSQYEAFSALPTECKFQRVKICPPGTDTIALEWVLRLLLPLVTKPGTRGCRCRALPGGTCVCRTAEQKRMFDSIDVSVYDGYDHWKDDFANAKYRTAKVLLDMAWSGYAAQVQRIEGREERAMAGDR